VFEVFVSTLQTSKDEEFVFMLYDTWPRSSSRFSKPELTTNSKGRTISPDGTLD
jgi:hypothetical protein